MTGSACNPINGIFPVTKTTTFLNNKIIYLGTCNCPPGHIGADCSIKCSQGTFGIGCKHECKCMEENTKACDYRNGLFSLIFSGFDCFI